MTSSIERLAAIRVREADPTKDEYAREQAGKITARMDAGAQRMLRRKAVDAETPRVKVFLLRRLADNLGAVAGPLVACSKGCSHCCKMPVLINEIEAKEIAKATGARMATPEFTGKADHSLDGVPCTFLVNGACSIYENRPFACRVHYVMDRDETLCEIFPGESIEAPHLQVDDYHFTYAQTFGKDGLRRMADVRAFFPRGLSKKRSAA